MKTTIFISSVQNEFAAERRAMKDYILGDILLRRFFDVFLFEDIPASDRRADNVYLEKVAACGIYVGLFGDEYGSASGDDLSPTEREFDRATAKAKVRLIFVKGKSDQSRHPKMLSLIRKAGSQLIRRRFSEIPDLTAAIYASLVEYLGQTGNIRTKPFDATACPDAKLNDLSREKVAGFLARAQAERAYAFGPRTSMRKALEHLNLLDGESPTHAAILLFAKTPQRFLISSEVKCMHFHGTEVRKPIPSYHVYKGTVFELVDQAVDFTMANLARSVGTRAKGPEAPVAYELPREAVAEAIVNAVAHRDYTSNASAQIMLFADRLEVWNPGELPPALTIERLRRPHASIPRNPLICEPMFLARYVEKAGSGILDMINLCKQAGLPEPEFRQDGGQFVQTLWRPKSASPAKVMPEESSTTGTKPALSRHQVEIMRKCLTESTLLKLMAITGRSDRTKFRNQVLKPLLTDGLIEMTLPDKPRSSKQQYRLTDKGRVRLEKEEP